MTFDPQVMTPELARELEADGYLLPTSWPHSARVTTELSQKTGWKVTNPGTLRKGDDGRAREMYVAPDGTKLVKVANGKKPVLVAVFKRYGPTVLALAPHAKHPGWIPQTKGEVPEQLKPHLLKKGEKLQRGEKRAPVVAVGLGPDSVVVVSERPADPLDQILANLDQRIEAAQQHGGRASPGLLAYRTRLSRELDQLSKIKSNNPVRFAEEVAKRLDARSSAPVKQTDDGHRRHLAPGIEPLESTLQEWERARVALHDVETRKVERSIPARRAVLTRKVTALRTEWALAHPTEAGDGNGHVHFLDWLTAKATAGIPLPALEPRRSPSRPATERMTVTEVLAAGQVKIVATAKQLTKRKKWWSRDGQVPQKHDRRSGIYESDQRRAQAEARRADPVPLWQQPVSVRAMSYQQRDAVLQRQARRLRDHYDCEFTREEVA